MNHPKTIPGLGVAGAIVACAFAATAANAQNALGEGRALDRPLQQGVRHNTPVSNLAAELRFRNAIVTGNAPGGASFRGDVGYRASGEFTGGDPELVGALERLGLDAGSLGGAASNDLFAFQRDALYSGLATRGIRGIEGLQQQMRLATGASAGDFAALPIARRAATSTQSFGHATGADSIDPFGLSTGTLRSTSEYLSDSFLRPREFARDSTDRPGEALTVYSITPLLGVNRSERLIPTDAAPVESEESDGADGRLGRRVDSYIDPGLVSRAYIEMFEDLRARAASDVAAEPAFTTTPDPSDPAPEFEPIPTDEAPGATTLLSSELEGRLSRLRAAMRGEPAADGDEELRDADISRTIGVITSAAPLIETLVPADAARDFYAEQMRTAQRHLRDGRWFDAEERFTSALAIRPNDPLAAVGRVHAEIGATLFLSASINLQRLLRQSPEFVAVRFDPSLLPNESRLATVASRLRENAARTNPMARHSGLLLAYLGHQTGDAEMIEAGLEAVLRVDAAENPDAPVDPFIDILRRAWAPR